MEGRASVPPLNPTATILVFAKSFFLLSPLPPWGGEG
jgi:hypothetical protein